MYGSGKTIFGARFHQFLLMNKDFIQNGGKVFPGSITFEDCLNALCDETIYVYLDLYSFPKTGERFEYALYECICKDALSSNLVDKELAEGVIRLIPQRTTEWLTTLLQVTKKKYLFVFIDEIGLLGEPKRFQFNDLQSPSSNESPSAVYRMFFGLLSPLARVNRVLCVVAGRSDAIVRQKEDAMPSRVPIGLDPFSLQTTDAYIRNAKYDDVPLQNIVFPHIPHGMDYLSRIVWEYTSGVPIYVRHVLSQMEDLSEEELREKIETIVPDSSLFVDPSRMRPETIAVFSSMLLVSVLEIPIHQEETYYGGIKLGAYSKYALDIASNFGFYYSQENKTFKLVYPKIVLNYLEQKHSGIVVFGFINHLVSSMSLYGAPVTRGIVFEILIALLLYLRLCFCSRLSMISMFRKTWVEDFEIRGDGSMRMRRYRPSYVASFSSSVSGDISSTGQTFHPSAWKAFFDTYLSKEDGIFIPVTPQSRGPDLIVRISKQAETETNNPSSTPLNKNRQEPIYVIGISLKCYRMDRGGIGRSQIKEEVEKFLIPISKDIDLEEQNVFAIQLIVSTKYTEQVSKQFTDNQNWVLNSGIYYEQDNRELNVRPHNAPPLRGAVSQWLSIPDRCQLVVCSTETLKTFLGSDAYKELQSKLEVDNSLPQTEKLSVLSVVLDSWFSHMPYRVSESEEKSATPEIDSFSDTNAMQVDYGRKRVVRDEPQGSSVSLETNVQPGMNTSNAMQLKGREVAGSSSFESSFDWNTFLRERCSLSEQEITYCLPKISFIQQRDLDGVTTDFLCHCGIDNSSLRLRIMLGIRKFLGL
eukprot:jgi/Galph1/4550/GphlegSOOS_G3203.1